MRVIAGGIVVAFALGCSSSGGGGNNGGGGGSSGSCSVATSPNACLGPGRDKCNPCSKIPYAQLNAAVGLTLTGGYQNGDACQWLESDTNGPNGNPGLAVTFTVGFDASSSICDSSPGSVNLVPVSGVGDSACYWQVDQVDGWALHFNKGCVGYELAVVPGDTQLTEAQQQAEERTLALDAIANL